MRVVGTIHLCAPIFVGMSVPEAEDEIVLQFFGLPDKLEKRRG